MTTRAPTRPKPTPRPESPCGHCHAPSAALHWDSDDRLWRCWQCSRPQDVPEPLPLTTDVRHYGTPRLREPVKVFDTVTLTVAYNWQHPDALVSIEIKFEPRVKHSVVRGVTSRPPELLSVRPNRLLLERIRDAFEHEVGTPLWGLSTWWQKPAPT